jgi:protein-S-isoprenylcysteine O-methyltransferase Ste14
MVATSRLVLHAAVAFLVLPGTVAFAVPLLWLRPAHPLQGFNFAGFTIAAIGSALLLWCVGHFFVSGRGSLAPWAPPERLVRAGPYRASRNPMYLGVLLILTGWALAFRSPTLGVYAALVAVAFHLRIRLAEEPWLARTFPDDWPPYSQSVPRWMPTWRALTGRITGG